MKTVIYSSTLQLSCLCNAEVVLCVEPSLSADGSGILDATLVRTTYSTNSFHERVYNYYIDYDESLLADPSYSLVNADVNGVLCKGCLTQYILAQFVQQGDALINTRGYIYVFPPGPPPMQPGEPFWMNLVSVVGNVVTLDWHVVTPVP